MNVIEILFYVFLFTFPLILGFSVVAGASFASRWPKYFVYPYLAVLVFFTGSEYGLLERSGFFTIYDRGHGQLYFSIVNLYLFWLAAVVGIQGLWLRLETPTARLRRYLLAFNIIFIGNVMVGLLFADRSIFELLLPRGAFYVVNTSILVFVLLRTFREPREIERLENLFLICATARGLFGLLRFAFLGGDPANHYANFQAMDVRLTFFDINDNIIATVAALIAASRLVERSSGRLLYWFIVAAELSVVLLSFRRTAWIGLLGAVMVFAWVYRRRINIVALMPVLGVALVALVGLWQLRFASASGQGGLLATLFPDVTSGGQLSTRSGRLFELRLALETIFENPIFGVGTWGEYAYSSDQQVSFHRGRFDFMHSGFLHIWLKMGLVGLLAFAGALWVSARDAWRFIPAATPVGRSLAIAGLGGLAASMPTILFGTPIIEYRTMQLLAIILVLPYLGLAHDKLGRGHSTDAPATAA